MSASLLQKAEDTKLCWDDRSDLCLLKVGHLGRFLFLFLTLFNDKTLVSIFYLIACPGFVLYIVLLIFLLV